MSYPLDPAAQSAALDALLSRDVSGIPTVWEVALWDGHPALSGTAELTSAGGYARVLLNADLTDWPAASSGLKTSMTVDFGTSTAAYSDTGRYWVLIDHGDSVTRWFFGQPDDELTVDAAGVGVAIQLRDYWNQEGA